MRWIAIGTAAALLWLSGCKSKDQTPPPRPDPRTARSAPVPPPPISALTKPSPRVGVGAPQRPHQRQPSRPWRRHRSSASLFSLFKVKSFRKWKKAFDSSREALKKTGLLMYSVSRLSGKGNPVLFRAVAPDPRRLRRVLVDKAYKLPLHEGGLRGEPTLWMALDTDLRSPKKKVGSTYTIFFMQKVARFLPWKIAFDKEASALHKAGVVAHSVSRHLRRPNEILVHLMTTNRGRTLSVLRNKARRKRLQAAGALGEPKLHSGRDLEVVALRM